MKTLVAMHLVQFSFWEYETFLLAEGGTAFIGPNGAGKTSLVDAIQIGMLGAHGNYMEFNAQSVQKDARSIRDYALGTMRSEQDDKSVMTRKRTEAMSYITLVFEDGETGDVLSAGLAIWSTEKEKHHKVLGLYVLPGVRLDLEHHLEDLGEQGMAPIEWGIFDAQARKLCAAAGRTPTITGHAEQYLNELLHNLADQKHAIDPKKFAKALKQSIRLKDVNSVGDFLRENLVEATQIDKKGTLLHIKTLRRLGQQIEDVENQLAQLGTLSNRYDYLARLHRTRAVSIGVALHLKVENADNTVAGLLSSDEELRTALSQAKEVLRLKITDAETALRTYDDLAAAFNADPEAGGPEQARKLMTATAEVSSQARRVVEKMELAISEALQSVAIGIAAHESGTLDAVRGASKLWESRRGEGVLATRVQIKDALELLSRIKPLVERVHNERLEVLRRASLSRARAQDKLDAASKGMRIRDEDVPLALGMFTKAGIACHTVASVVRVKDVNWQGAIETFLGRNRYAIVVQRGREREAVALLRNSDLAEVTVVQPNHLRDTMERTVESGTVAELLESEDKVAFAFLARILGKMRRVKTEAELEEHQRALTSDCMLSANGGTKRMRAIDPADWVLGMTISSADRAALRQDLLGTTEAEQKAKQHLDLSANAIDNLRGALRSITIDGYASTLADFEAANARAEAAKDPAALQLPERLRKLRVQVDAARDRLKTAQSEHASASGAIAKLEKDLETNDANIAERKAWLARLIGERDIAITHPDYDVEYAANRLHSAYSSDATMIAQLLQDLQNDAESAQKSIDKSLPDIRDEFITFINQHSINLVDERSDWRKAVLWVRAHSTKLRDSTLTMYKAEAEAAREAAERAFEADVKYSLREALRRVEREIRDLNNVLDRCPPFTNGERYHFSAKVDEQHQKLYDLIVKISDEGETASLFDDSDVQNKLMSLMEAAEIGADKGNNPLEDYRLFYRFDLEIRVDGKVVDLLSKRMGVASNGEHRVPFYVIAGTALATAYRIKPGERHRGAGVMILDEAFYGIDAQNTVVTAEFLKSLGLQLVMAGPDSDTSKLTAILDSYYDLTRFGSDVFVERIGIKEAARELMQSDMPERHPHLVDRAMTQLSLEAN